MSGAVVLRVLKRDVFGRVELLADGEHALIRRVACGSRVPGSRAVAHLLASRERRALAALAGLEGVPHLVEDRDAAAAPALDGARPDARDVIVRSFVEGHPLHRAETLPEDFFERLDELVRAVHACGVCHNDLHKEQNVIVGADGWPYLVDFQLASCHRAASRAFAVRAKDDLRHVAKHRRRYLRHAPNAPARPAEHLPPRSRVALIWRRTAKPLYNLVTRGLLRTRDGEARRGIEGPWPRWVEAVGPRRGSVP